MAVYDKKNNLWRSPKEKSFSHDDRSPGQRLLDVISAHGSKIAQVH